MSLPHNRETVKSLFVSCIFWIVLNPGVVSIVHIKGIVIFLHMKTLSMIFSEMLIKKILEDISMLVGKQ